MVTKMILISLLILAILFATWVKDRDKMNPPLKRRVVIDLTVIGALWLLYLVFVITNNPTTMALAEDVINLGLWYFVAQFIYLIAKLSPLFNGLIALLKKKGYAVPELEPETEEKESNEP